MTSTESDIASQIRNKEKVSCDHLFSVQTLIEIKPLQVLLIAVTYYLLARVSQTFAIDPGNVSPIWLPSGVMFALALRYGIGIWPGIFLGALFGNVWSYIDSANLLDAIIAGVFNGVGDSICVVGAASAIYHLTNTNNPLHRKSHFSAFILLGVILGPFISALFGVLGLSIFGFLSYDYLNITFFTWWIGDAVGVLVLGPLLITWFNKETIYHKHSRLVFTVICLLTSIGTASVFELILVPIEVLFMSTVLLPLLLIVMVHYGQRILYTVQVIVLSIAVTATAQKIGPFALEDANMSLVQLQWFIAIFSCSIFGLAVVTYENQNAKKVIFEKMTELEKLYRTDNLTGIANRHLINEFFEREFARMARTNQQFGVILIDLDDFKRINDEFGHNVGDQVLIQLCEVIQSQIRNYDLLGRWGGEEFIVICDKIDEAGIRQVSEKIRAKVEETMFVNFLHLSISLGVTLAMESDSINTVTKRADDGLYDAKRKGKNRVTFVKEES